MNWLTGVRYSVLNQLIINREEGLNSIGNTSAFKMMGTPLVIKGFTHGLCHPSLALLLTINVQNCQEWLSRVDQALSAFLQVDHDENLSHQPLSGQTDEVRAVNSLLYWMSKFQQEASVPVFEQGKIIGINSKARSVRIVIPIFSSSHQVIARAFFVLMKVFNGLYSGKDMCMPIRELQVIVKQLEQMVPRSSNMPRFLRNAFRIGIPYSEFPGQVYQFGYGVRARLLDSSFTDQTSQIGTRLARIKTLTAEVLRGAGIPVPDHTIVTDVNNAVTAACDLGFPVVVKPADLDGGVGVAAGLTTKDEVREAFAAAQKKSRRILVEKHYDGRDYRLTVFQGELIWAVERMPGGVTGDGKSTIQILVDRLNDDPHRGVGTHSLLKRIVLDDEAQSLLSKAGLDLNSIPGEGEFVRLRRTANVACGGIPVAVFEHVHPDNSLLAVRAAAALRLDLAGVDLLIPDISRSWRESGAVVCEVNAQPNLGGITSAHLYAQILHKLVQGNGRIPIAVIIGASPDLNLAAAISARLSDAGLVTGRVDHEGVSIGLLTISAGVVDPYTGGRILTGEKGVAAVVLCINDTSVLHTGLPFERFDILVFAGSHLIIPVSQSGQSIAMQLRALFDAFSPCCDGKVIAVAGSGIEVCSLPSFSSAELLQEPVAQHCLVATIAEAMIEAEENHRIGRPAFFLPATKEIFNAVDQA
jgi:cyanophycin synthetase